MVSCLEVLGLNFVGCHVPHGGADRNETSDTLIKRGAMKKISEVSYNILLLASPEISSILQKTA